MFLCAVVRPHINTSQILGGIESWGFGPLGIGASKEEVEELT